MRQAKLRALGGDDFADPEEEKKEESDSSSDGESEKSDT